MSCRYTPNVPCLRAGTIFEMETEVAVISLSVTMAYAVPSCSGTSYSGLGLGAVGAGIEPKCDLMRFSTTPLSKSPTAITAMRSGRYQSL